MPLISKIKVLLAFLFRSNQYYGKRHSSLMFYNDKIKYQ